MDSDARALLDAKLALEAEIVRPISIVSLDYIDACRANGGRQLPTFTRIQHAERMEAVLLRHYCRVSMVVTNRRPPRDPSPAEAALSLRHQESMILRSRREAQRILDSIDREFAREMARAMPSPATVDDGTGQKDERSQNVILDDDMEIKAKVSGVSAGMVGQFSSRLAAIANANTNAVAEEARQANLIDELEEGDERLVQVWNSLLDGRERMSHGDAHGQRRPIEEPFEVGGALLRFPGDSGLGAPISETINCFPAGTLVSADVLAATRHWYVGELVEITTGLGHKLSGTPNHPVLTPEGWVALGSLHEGGHVISRSVSRSNDTTDCMNVAHYVDDVEPGIEQVFDALSVARVPVRVGSVAVDFHGYAPAQDVDVVSSDRTLRVGYDSTISQHCNEGFFASASLDLGPLFPRSLPLNLYGAGFAAATSGIGSRSDDAALFVGRTGHSLVHGSGSPTDICSAAQKPSPDRATVDAEVLGESLLRHSGFVERDHIVSIKRNAFSGHVYNLQSQHEMYYANGIVVHNCRCFLITIAVKPDGTERRIHQGTSAPARRQRRRGDRAIGPTRNPPVKPGTSDRVGDRMPATPTSVVTLNGNTRATVVLGNGRLATLRQETPNTIVVRVGRTTIARASTMAGSVTSIQVNPAWSASGVEGLIARSVAHSAARRN